MSEEHSDGADELAELYASMTPIERAMLWLFIIIKLYGCQLISQTFGVLVGITFHQCVDCGRNIAISISVGILAHLYVYMSLRVLAARNI